MRHAYITKDDKEKSVEVSLSNYRQILLAESEYSQEELEKFYSTQSEWLLQCKGSHSFLADSDSGEDAYGYYCGYCEPVPERVVFDNGELVGFYICTDGISYSGRGRYNFDVTDWGFPGADPFDFIPRGAKTHVFLFADEETHKWGEWTLIKREPGKEYESYLDF